MNIRQIYWLHAVLLAGLFAALAAVLLKNRMNAELFSLALSMVMISVWFVPFCLEYTWVFFCMLISSVLGIQFAVKGSRAKLSYLFLITGMVTVYLDFLSTETLTLVIPLLLILRVWRKHTGKGDASRTAAHPVAGNSGQQKRTDEGDGCMEEWLFALKSAVLWAVGYVGMWVSKWIIASAVLHENVMTFVRDHISDRIEGVNPTGSSTAYIVGAIRRNVKCLLPFDYGMAGAAFLLVLIVVFVVLPTVTDKVTIRNEINKKLIALYLIIGGIPILRFAVLHSHSWYHRSFTYRALAGTILALCCVAAEIVGWKKKAEKAE